MLLILQIFKKFLTANIWKTIAVSQAEILDLYRENMIIEEVARQIPRTSCAPGIPNIPKIFKRECVENHAHSQAEISDFVSGEHGYTGGGTPNPKSQLCCWYFKFSKNL